MVIQKGIKCAGGMKREVVVVVIQVVVKSKEDKALHLADSYCY